MRIITVLHNIRSVYNVGAILRTADGVGVETVVFSGYTPRYNDPKLLPHLREKLNHQIEKSALGAEKSVRQEIIDDLPAWIGQRRRQGWQIIGLENNLTPDEAHKRWILGEKNRTLAPDSALVLILGEEVYGIPPEIRALMDSFLEIPMHGQKESFNVSVAAGIAMWALQNLAITNC